MNKSYKNNEFRNNPLIFSGREEKAYQSGMYEKSVEQKSEETQLTRFANDHIHMGLHAKNYAKCCALFNSGAAKILYGKGLQAAYPYLC